MSLRARLNAEPAPVTSRQPNAIAASTECIGRSISFSALLHSTERLMPIQVALFILLLNPSLGTALVYSGRSMDSSRLLHILFPPTA